VDNNRCSAFKDRFCSGQNHAYVDMDFAATAPVALPDGWQFVSEDGRITKVVQLAAGPRGGAGGVPHGPRGGHALHALRAGPQPAGPDAARARQPGGRRTPPTAACATPRVGRPMWWPGATYRSSTAWPTRVGPPRDAAAGAVRNQSGSTNWTVALAFSEAAARDLDGDGLNNTNEFLAGTDHEKWDTDGDNMPDGYEVANGLAARSTTPGTDSDGDRMANWAEFVAGTAAGQLQLLLWRSPRPGAAGRGLPDPPWHGQRAHL
jgi:hypothetical protein